MAATTGDQHPHFGSHRMYGIHSTHLKICATRECNSRPCRTILCLYVMRCSAAIHCTWLSAICRCTHNLEQFISMAATNLAAGATAHSRTDRRALEKLLEFRVDDLWRWRESTLLTAKTKQTRNWSTTYFIYYMYLACCSIIIEFVSQRK